MPVIHMHCPMRLTRMLVYTQPTAPEMGVRARLRSRHTWQYSKSLR